MLIISQKRGPSKGYNVFLQAKLVLLISRDRYAEALENKVEKMVKIIRKVGEDRFMIVNPTNDSGRSYAMMNPPTNP